MLVITRKTDEGLMIGDNIKITVSEISKDRVKLGIEAPGDVKIIRNELYETEKTNKQAASTKLPMEILTKIINGSQNADDNK